MKPLNEYFTNSRENEKCKIKITFRKFKALLLSIKSTVQRCSKKTVNG